MPSPARSAPPLPAECAPILRGLPCGGGSRPRKRDLQSLCRSRHEDADADGRREISRSSRRLLTARHRHRRPPARLRRRGRRWRFRRSYLPEPHRAGPGSRSGTSARVIAVELLWRRQDFRWARPDPGAKHQPACCELLPISVPLAEPLYLRLPPPNSPSPQHRRSLLSLALLLSDVRVAWCYEAVSLSRSGLRLLRPLVGGSGSAGARALHLVYRPASGIGVSSWVGAFVVFTFIFELRRTSLRAEIGPTVRSITVRSISRGVP